MLTQTLPQNETIASGWSSSNKINLEDEQIFSKAMKDIVAVNKLDWIIQTDGKNWPIHDNAHVHFNQIEVTMCPFGFNAVTQSKRGIGEAVIEGTRYEIMLPGKVIDEGKLTVNFERVSVIQKKQTSSPTEN